MTYKLSAPGWFSEVNGITVVHNALPADFMQHAGSFVAHHGIELHRQQGPGDDLTGTQIDRGYPIATFNVGPSGTPHQYNHMFDYAPWHGDSVSEYAYGIETSGVTGTMMTVAQLKTLHALCGALIEVTEDRFGETIPLIWIPEVTVVNYKTVKGFWNHRAVAQGPLNENGHSNIMEGETNSAFLKAVKELMKPPKPAPKFHGVLLRLGVDATDVVVWKRRMGSKGLFMLHSSGDGPHYGPTIEQATKEFQRRRHLRQDGIVGPKTWAAAWGG